MLLSAPLDRHLPSLRRLLWAVAAAACLIAASLHTEQSATSASAISAHGVDTARTIDGVSHRF